MTDLEFDKTVEPFVTVGGHRSGMSTLPACVGRRRWCEGTSPGCTRGYEVAPYSWPGETGSIRSPDAIPGLALA